MAFDDAGVPGGRKPGGDRIHVSLEAAGEGVKAGEIVGANSRDPLGDLLAVALGEHAGEGTDVPGEGFQLGAVDERGLQPDPVILLKSVGVGEQPAGDRPHRGRPDGRGTRVRP